MRNFYSIFKPYFIIIAAMLAALVPSVSWSASFTVNIAEDIDDAINGDGICETAAGNAQCSLRAAIQESNALGGADLITLPAGTYVNTRTLGITSDLTINGAGTSDTIIDGGAVSTVITTYLNPEINVEIKNLVIQNGRQDSGDTPNTGYGCGGLSHYEGTLTLSRVIVRDNLANFAGGICNQSILNIEDSSISGNTTDAGGAGGIVNYAAGTLNILNSAIINNAALDQNYNTATGGGIENGGLLYLTNVTLSGNSSQYMGGALHMFGGEAVLSNVTITNNTSGIGGALSNFNNDPLSIKNSIIANNSGEPFCNGKVISLGYNLANVTSCGFANDDTNIIHADVGLGTRQDNGGPASTHALLPTSPAIDAANPAGCTDQDDVVIIADQRGATRPADGGSGTFRCDIGAYEYNAPLANAGTNQVVNYKAEVMLDGSNSHAPAGITDHQWEQIAGNSSVLLQDEASATASFTAPSAPGALEFRLSITDANSTTASDTVVIMINTPPLSDAGPDQTVNTGDAVKLDGSVSSDADGTIAAYSWIQLSGASVTLADRDTPTPGFTAPASPDNLIFQLSVTDNHGAQTKSTVTVTVNNAATPNSGGGCSIRTSAAFDPILPLLLGLLMLGLLRRRNN